MEVLFKVIRQQHNSSAKVQTYLLQVEPGNTILDCLNRIKWEQDGTLAFRKNCRNTICGSCAMRINGRSALACKENVGSEISRLQQLAAQTSNANAIPEITIAPLGNMPVIKDLVVDMNDFWNNLEAIAPYVSTASRNVPEREFLQTPQERSRLDQTGNCIMCGACFSECNGFEVNSKFVGPHALAKAYRMVADNRDSETENRLEKYNEGTQGVWGCTRCFYCNSVCPMDVAPLDQITKIKQEILAHKQKSDSRSIRHRKVLVELVKAGGWIDERQFALQVVGNYFRDLRGLLGIAPLGLRMLAKGKFPLSFEPSEGTQQVRSLIEAIEQEGNRE
ncbi:MULTISPECIES: succinate dehydrogenase/fumarate reductase iron-sulfur subunit [Fischerella]|jgi:succinate dehydrogenase / fumarate reductase iron-sulfur subunit|uniref:succinate dehydrogenase n=3 Tax=Fischerella TaxID=1190 RepID=G6FNG8_9CYAN|nr:MULTISPECIES: succinate dehydrogenase/fumarate reductase iron-sulfur subunit [Fischerella]PLZ80120.1 succinate dehydrogenase [Fischerella thermalis WC217]PMB03044.1 succinate dehydrogenase [Fischerella thermalis CCMEE 5328]BCX08373.1 MAG: succinate dehydrogenase iron-sulfur subunit [Fischerella sp.]EHC19598.1 succinate dehydrogenase and fumarate reductase iron-sulfur protein [Fischerella thermalis JSC-11]OKH11046.1 succinate dehydrogenase [Fischerella major NIES-592]